jgi:hypothetical protein
LRVGRRLGFVVGFLAGGGSLQSSHDLRVIVYPLSVYALAGAHSLRPSQ